MKNAKEFKERMHDEEFAKLFSNAETDKEIIKIAAGQGYEITKDDIRKFEMTDEMLESVAGGKNDTAGRDMTKSTYINIEVDPNVTTHSS